MLRVAKRNRRSRHFCRENLQLNAERPASRRFSKKPHIASTAEGTGMNKCARASNENRKDSSLTKAKQTALFDLRRAAARACRTVIVVHIRGDVIGKISRGDVEVGLTSDIGYHSPPGRQGRA